MMALPQRIVSLAPSNTEILYALGVGERVVGVTRYCDWPLEARRKALDVGGCFDIQDRQVTSLAPDLILTNTPVRDRVSARLVMNGAAVLSVDPKTLDEAFESIQIIGEVVGAATMAQAIRADLRRHMMAAQIVRRRRPRLYIEDWHMPPTAAGGWVPELATWAGGESGLARPGQRSVEVSDEAIVAYDPEVIVLAWCGFGRMSQVEQMLARPGWSSLTAVRNRRVHVMDDSYLNRPGPRLILGLRQLASILTG